MKRAPFVMLAAVVLSLPAYAQEPELHLPPTTLAQMDLRGPVRSVEIPIEYWRSSSGGGETAHARVTRMSFDRAGSLVEKVRTEDGALLERTVYTYDEKGRNIGYREESRSSTSGPFSLQRWGYVLDSQGRVLARDLIDSAGVARRKFVYHRDASGRLTGDSFGLRGGRREIEYDARGNRIAERYYGSDARFDWASEASFDDAGRLVESRHFEHGTPQYVITFRYDERGRLVERVIRDFPTTRGWSHSPVPGREVYAYSDDGRRKETTLYTPDGALKEWTVERFDEHGKLLERARLTAAGGRTLTQVDFAQGREIHAVSGTRVERWEFDRYGNWTCRSVFVVPTTSKAAPACVETRKITYW